MHKTSFENMRRALAMCGNRPGGRVLEVGGRGLDGESRTYRSLIEAAEYANADIRGGQDVTHVMPGLYDLPFEADYFDLVVSGQVLEHVPNPFLLVDEMRRVLKPGGYVILIAPSAGRMHDNPDCWRFMRDGFFAIAAECDIIAIADWIHGGDQWRDHVFVGLKPAEEK